jgi:hypothetical protein
LATIGGKQGNVLTGYLLEAAGIERKNMVNEGGVREAGFPIFPDFSSVYCIFTAQ